MALIPPGYFDCVVAIGSRNENGYVRWIGTGCLFGRFFQKASRTENQYHIFIVTNKHVLANLQTAVIRFNPAGTFSAKDYDIPLTNDRGEPLWRGHSKIDLAAIGVNGKVLDTENIQYNYFRSDNDLMTLAEMNLAGESEGDFIYVLGFPMGIVNMDRQYVIARSGIIARLRDAIEKQSQDYLIDALVFPGNSGGPVLYKPEILSIQGTRSVVKPALIGIVSSYLSYKDTAVSQQTGDTRVIFEENSGLSVAIPVDYVLQTIEDCFVNQTVRENNPDNGFSTFSESETLFHE